MSEHALIVGAGPGLSASLARLFARQGMAVSLASRNPDRLAALCEETRATAHRCDVTEEASVAALFAAVGEVDTVVYNASGRVRGAFVDLPAAEVARTLTTCAFGGFLVAQAAVKQMLPRGQGTILFTGASASIKGYAQSAPFAMGKFALRGMAESMARELGPQGIHVAHFVIDGGIGTPGGGEDRLDPDAIAATYLHVLRQPRSAWTFEVALRPSVERF